MSLDLIKEELTLSRLAFEASAQTVVENDIIVPDSKPDISKILLAEGRPVITETEYLHEKAVFKGYIDYNVLYLSDEEVPRVKSIFSTCEFKARIDDSRITQDLRGTPACVIEHNECQAANSRKLQIKSILTLKDSFSESVSADLITGINDLPETNVLRSSVSINSPGTQLVNTMGVAESLVVPSGYPAVSEILRDDIKIIVREARIEDGRLFVDGDISAKVLYTGDDEKGSIQLVENEFPFSQAYEADGIEDNPTCFVSGTVGSKTLEICEDSDGENRAININAGVEFRASTLVSRQLDLLDDAYPPDSRLLLDKKAVRLSDMVHIGDTQVNIKEIIPVSETGTIGKVMYVDTKPFLTEVAAFEGKLSIEGFLAVDILYYEDTELSMPASCATQVPFKHSVDVQGLTPDMKPSVEAVFGHCSYSIASPTEIDLRVTVNIHAEILNTVSVPLVTKIYEAPDDTGAAGMMPPVIMYFVQPGDTLWKIAKKYLVTVEDIIKLNNLPDDELQVGNQLMIIKKDPDYSMK